MDMDVFACVKLSISVSKYASESTFDSWYYFNDILPMYAVGTINMNTYTGCNEVLQKTRMHAHKYAYMHADTHARDSRFTIEIHERFTKVS